MDNYQDMRKFIQATSEYLSHQGDSYATDLQRLLQIITSAIPLENFDPANPIVTQFYASLHELMSGLDSRSMLVWSAISVLQKACCYPSAKTTLIHTFKFMPVLSRFLNFDVIGDKQLRLLQVMRELTYGVKITWEEAYLPHLISILVKIVMEGNDEYQPAALEVLVNLCYGNLPVLYVLMGKVDINLFIKCITKLNNNSLIRMHVCKMLLILEQIKGPLPEKDVLNFVDVVFSTVNEAYQNRDITLLRQVVDFYKDIKESHNLNNFAARYDKGCQETKKLIALTEPKCGDEQKSCLAIVLEFLEAAFPMTLQKDPDLLLSVLQLSVGYLRDEEITIACLKILRIITEHRTSEIFSSSDDVVLKKLSEILPIVVGLFDDLIDVSTLSVDSKKTVSNLAALLTTMSDNTDLRKQILSLVSCETIRNIFQAVFKNSSVDQEPIFHPHNGDLCVKMLSLVSKLANFRADWMSFSAELLSKRYILMELAITFADGDKCIKYEILRLIGSNAWSKEYLVALCEMMTNLKNTGIIERAPSVQSNRSPREVMPMYSSQHETRLNELLDALNLAKEEGRLAECTTSSVMELYEYKLGALGQAERRIQASLEASDARCTGLNHQVAQLRSEVLRLHELLFSYQLSIEGAKREKNSLIEKQKALKDIQANEKTQLTRQIKEFRGQIAHLEKNLAAKDIEMKTRVSQMEQKIKNMNETIATCETNMQKSKAEYETRISILLADKDKLQTTLSETMKENEQKDQEIAECKRNIEDLEHIRKMVINIAAKNKNDSS